jgi:hypothetical protein
MDRQPRRSMKHLVRDDIPTSPGVYALYRSGERVYAGKADSLRERIWKNHSGRGPVMTSSALRRNIAERLGIASAADIKAGRYQPDPGEVARVRVWLDRCEIAWRECESSAAALRLETAMKAEEMPPLTKR